MMALRPLSCARKMLKANPRPCTCVICKRLHEGLRLVCRADLPSNFECLEAREASDLQKEIDLR